MTLRLPSRRSNRFVVRLGVCLVSALVPLAVMAQPSAQPETVWLRTTNYLPRLITNIITVYVPTNSFRDEYRTNWLHQKVTNVVDLFRTNVVSVDEFRTNFQTAYTTNLKAITLTNLETVLLMRTNWITVPVTNVVDFTNTLVARLTHTNEIVAYETNVVRAWQTNLKVLTLTNWETVLVMKTNWVSVPLTNVVELEVPVPQPATPVASGAPAASPPESAAPSAPAPAAVAADLPEQMDFELTHTGKPVREGQYPVRLVLKPGQGGEAIIPVQEWRVEKINGGAFMVGSRPEFSGTLPAGSYRVTVRLRGADNVLRSLRCEIEVKADGSPEHSPALAVTR